jgi:flavin reductase
LYGDERLFAKTRERLFVLSKTLARKAGSVMIREPYAKVAELADAQDSGSCDRKVVGVQVPPFAPTTFLHARPRRALWDARQPRNLSREAGNRVPIDPISFRRLVGNFATGVTVVTTSNEGMLHGMTANSFTSVSLDPLLVLVCVDKTAHGHVELLRCESFAVNLLAAEQKGVSSLFAKTGEPEAGRLRGGVAYRLGQTGCPIIDGSLAWLECTPHAHLDAGDHTIFVGKVVGGDVERPGDAPLLYFRGSYCGIDTP